MFIYIIIYTSIKILNFNVSAKPSKYCSYNVIQTYFSQTLQYFAVAVENIYHQENTIVQALNLRMKHMKTAFCCHKYRQNGL